MKMLYLDTSNRLLSLAVTQDKKILSQIRVSLDRKHSVQLIPLIDKILKKAKLSLKQIDSFCACKGPGSFTGLRIGITCIKGLAYIFRKPVTTIPSLDILAQNVFTMSNFTSSKMKKIEKSKLKQLQVCPLIDARQNKVYASIYRMGIDRIERKSGYLLLPIDKLLKRLKGKVIFLGDGVERYRQMILKNKNIQPLFAKEKFWYPQIGQAVALALERFQTGQVDDIDNLVPLYLYPRECQIKKRHKS